MTYAFGVTKSDHQTYYAGYNMPQSALKNNVTTQLFCKMTSAEVCEFLI